MDYRKYYNELGKLLYAVANVDGSVQQKEIDEVHRLVKDQLIKLDDSMDDFNTDAAFFTEFEFDYLHEENVTSSEELLNSFKEYLESTPELTPGMIKAARRAAQRIAESFAGINKKEEEFLQKLDAVIGNR